MTAISSHPLVPASNSADVLQLLGKIETLESSFAEQTAQVEQITAGQEETTTKLEDADMRVKSHNTPVVAPFTATTEVLAANPDRIRALVQIEGGKVRVDNAVNGIITGDPISWEAQTAMTLHPQDGATITVRILEELAV